MAISGAYHVATGSPVSLESLDVPTRVRQLDITSNPANSETVYIGPSTVTAAGVNAWYALSPGQAWGAESEDGDLSIVPSDVFVVGTASDKVHVGVVV